MCGTPQNGKEPLRFVGIGDLNPSPRSVLTRCVTTDESFTFLGWFPFPFSLKGAFRP